VEQVLIFFIGINPDVMKVSPMHAAKNQKRDKRKIDVQSFIEDQAPSKYAMANEIMDLGTSMGSRNQKSEKEMELIIEKFEHKKKKDEREMELIIKKFELKIKNDDGEFEHKKRIADRKVDIEEMRFELQKRIDYRKLDIEEKKFELQKRIDYRKLDIEKASSNPSKSE
jgi:hypothetical protein